MNKKKTVKKQTKKIKDKPKSTGRDSERTRAYAIRRVLHPTESKKQSLIACDYSPNTHPYQIEKQPGFKNAIEELKAHAAKAKCTPIDQLKFFQKMRDATKHTPTSRIESGKEINKMLGYHAPQQIEVEQSKTESVNILVQAIRHDGVSIGELIKGARDGGEAEVIDNNG